MFTGIVEELGELAGLEIGRGAAAIVVRCPRLASGITTGESIAVNGCCLTVTSLLAPDRFCADVIATTLARTTLGGLRVGARVNLERAVPVTGRLGGHIVQGHVDGTGVVVDLRDGAGWRTARVEVPPRLAPYVAEQGSVAVDGVSLTVAEVGSDWFEVGLIPTTLTSTTLGGLRPRAQVNVEVDVLAKYRARLEQFEAA
jgi:riboflavin synthase